MVYETKVNVSHHLSLSQYVWQIRINGKLGPFPDESLFSSDLRKNDIAATSKGSILMFPYGHHRLTELGV